MLTAYHTLLSTDSVLLTTDNQLPARGRRADHLLLLACLLWAYCELLATLHLRVVEGPTTYYC